MYMSLPPLVANPGHWLPIYAEIRSQFRFRHGHTKWGIPAPLDTLLPIQLPGQNNLTDITIIAADGSSEYAMDVADWQLAQGPDGDFYTWLGQPHGLPIECGWYFLCIENSRGDVFFSEMMWLSDEHGAEEAGLTVSCGSGTFTFTPADTLVGTIVSQVIERVGPFGNWIQIGTTGATLPAVGTPGGTGSYRVRRRITTTRGNTLTTFWRLQYDVDAPCTGFTFKIYDYDNRMQHPDRFRLFWSNANDMQDIPALYATGYTQTAILDGHMDFSELVRDQEVELDGRGLERRISSTTKERYKLVVPYLIDAQAYALAMVNDHGSISLQHMMTGEFYTLSEVQFSAEPMADGHFLLGTFSFLAHKALNACEPGLDVSIL
jgi:hypothetical protein